ncbi:PEP/pyruvate-binding domain-containing protein [Sphingomonas hengshuiensis]|uniref:Phosphoenolpyruvate synthase n=1 Tax=Sphingomonas hengshuiensis TaxID=1609977 RepID=A0A7U4J6H6_9SPHN|nr:PEP/pyruvate-binding domain-containing protein [Sphingomonas hengshuiensis]AJP71156.1 hypothetical protein TS85_03975 [Sphingomonas hengshuiensis]
MTWRLEDREALRAKAPECGGKGSSLLRLVDWGMPVPPFLILPADAVAAWLHPLRSRIDARLAATDRDDPAQCQYAAIEISGWILAHPVDAAMAADTLARCRALFGAGYRCAVRSSALAEDGGKDSFAGQLDTYLHVGEADLLDRMRACVASLLGARTLHYRHHRGLPAGSEGIAVVVQQMVPAARAGVVFSMAAGGNLNEIVVAAAYGLGEGVVADRADSDHYFIARDSRHIHRAVAMKDTRLEPDPDRAWGLRASAVQADQRAAAVLSDDELRQLADLALDLERRQGCPQDLEFAFDGAGALFLLQARPITSLDMGGARDWVILDNANIVESYPGVTLPLGFDFARLAYRHVFAGAARAFGIPAGWIAANASVFEHLLAHLNGRIYYRLDNARRVTSKVLISVASQRGWQDFLGLASLPWPITRPGMGARVRALGRLTRLALGYRRNNRRLAAAFQSELHGLRAFVDGIDGQETATIWRFFESRAAALFAAWAPTIVNDYFTMKLNELLRRELGRLPGCGDGLGNDLLCGIEGLPSEEPFLALLALKRRIEADTVLQELFARPAAEVAARLADGDAAVPDDFRQAWSAYLREFGDRTLEELKLERPTLRMRPDLLASMVQNQLASPHDADTMRERQRAIRSAAEQRLAGALRHRPVRRRIVGLLLAGARQAVRDREAMRINRARAFGAVKEMFHALGSRMRAQGLLDQAEDVFTLRLDELRAFAHGGDHSDRRALVKERRREAAAQRAYCDMPDRLIFPPGQEPDLRHYAAAGGGEQAEDGVLRLGLGVSRGVVEATTLVLDAPELSQRVNGQILVTRMTDPGWIFLITQASGIIAEKGSLLSHTAIIGRELGIPTVVGVKGATSWLRDGARLRLDGGAGTVERLAEAAAFPASEAAA